MPLWFLRQLRFSIVRILSTLFRLPVLIMIEKPKMKITTKSLTKYFVQNAAGTVCPLERIPRLLK
jgi:hypothetical protein